MKSFVVHIGLKNYKVKFRKKIVEEGDECDGSCHYSDQLIELRKGQTPDMLLASFCHEWAHACLFEMDQEELADNESFVEALSHNMAKAIRTMPKEFK